jgi:hypothetical protein
MINNYEAVPRLIVAGGITQENIPTRRHVSLRPRARQVSDLAIDSLPSLDAPHGAC